MFGSSKYPVNQCYHRAGVVSQALHITCRTMSCPTQQDRLRADLQDGNSPQPVELLHKVLHRCAIFLLLDTGIMMDD